MSIWEDLKEIKKARRIIKNSLKKKPGQRWKAKPVVDVKKKTLKEKTDIVEDLSSKLPEEKEEKNSNWSKKVMNIATLQKLKLCFAVWMTDSQACYFCWISERSLYKYQKENPEFLQEKDVLKESITMQARVNVWRSIKSGSVWDSWKWLEKKDASFIPKLNLSWTVQTEMSPEDKKMYDKILQANKALFKWKKEIKK